MALEPYRNEAGGPPVPAPRRAVSPATLGALAVGAVAGVMAAAAIATGRALLRRVPTPTPPVTSVEATPTNTVTTSHEDVGGGLRVWEYTRVVYAEWVSERD